MTIGASPPGMAPLWSEIPEHFYKYRPITGDAAIGWAIDTIEQGSIYWAAPIEFNDPFDCAPKYVVPTGTVRRQLISRVTKTLNVGSSRAERRSHRRNLLKIPAADFEANFQNGMDEILKQSAVYSLSTDPTNILMWSHYAESHSGICLRFRGRPLFEQFLTGHWVTYEDQRPKVQIGAESEASLLRKILFTKAQPWEYEGEWRLVHYKGVRGVRHLNPGILDGVIFGARIKRATEHAVNAAIVRSGAPIEVMRAVEDGEEYKLTIEPA